jgi:ABC-type sugar transport system permease subunit
MASRTASSSVRNPRASFALVVALCGAVAVPAAIVLSRQTGRIHLLDSAWAIPVAMALSVVALLFARGASGQIHRTLSRAGGAGRLRATRWLAGLGICVALSASIAVGFYELLLRLEH